MSSEHYTLPFVHPVTGECMTNRCLMKDPLTSKIWMTAFRKEFGSMCQGNNKTGTNGTNAIFIMDPKDVSNIPKDQPPTYAKVVVAYRLQKEGPNCIQITARGNLVNFPSELTTQNTNITTAKLHWNSVLSTPNAKYVWLHIIFFI
jgi:hypothetical protein